MKLNLAALPKEELWRVFHMGYLTCFVLFRHADHGRAPTPEGVFDEAGPLVARIDAAGSHLRAVFELWYAREIGGCG